MIATINVPANISEVENQLVSKELIRILEVVLLIPINCLVALTGLLANVINVIILSKLDFTQTMSYGTMALSVTDLTVSGLQLTSEVFYVLHYVLEDSAVDFMAISTLPLGWMRYAGLNISGYITALIATERCFCVVFPFHVKKICNRRIYVVALILIYIVYLGFVIPIITAENFTWQPASELKNTSIRYIWTVAVDDDIVQLEKLFDTIYVLGFALLSQIILFASTLYMVHALRVSSQIRTSLDSCKSTSKPGQSLLSLRERRLISVAVWLAIIMFVCSIPRYIFVAFYAMFPTMQAETNIPLTNLLVDVTDIFINVNSFSTFIVYLSINRSYKERFFKLFCTKCVM